MLFSLACLALSHGSVDTNGAEPEPHRNGGKQGGGCQVRGARMPAQAFLTEVPAQELDVILGRPGPDRITSSILPYRPMGLELRLGRETDRWERQVSLGQVPAGKPFTRQLDGLLPNTRYYYQIAEPPGESGLQRSGTFHTARIEYVWSFLPGQAPQGHQNGQVAHAYEVPLQGSSDR